MPELSISVVIATRDRRELLRRVTEEVIAQLIPGDELIVVDDGTTEPEPSAWLEGHAVVLRSYGNGPAVARNLGWRRAAGEIVAFTDDDVILDAGWLAAIRTEFAAGKAVLAVEGHTVTREFDPLFEYSVQSKGPRNGLTCNVAYRRSALERLDGFDEGFPFAHCEDVDLFTRARRLGQVRYSRRMIVEHEPRTIVTEVHLKRAGWLSSERRLYAKNPELRGYPLPPTLCAIIDYFRRPLELWFKYSGVSPYRDVRRLRRAMALTLRWWWIAARALPALLLSRP